MAFYGNGLDYSGLNAYAAPSVSLGYNQYQGAQWPGLAAPSLGGAGIPLGLGARCGGYQCQPSAWQSPASLYGAGQVQLGGGVRYY